MISKSKGKDPNHVAITFELPSSLWADHIFVVGDFNAWSPTATPLRQRADGIWQTTVEMQRGSYSEFRYLINGRWQTDFHADGFVVGPCGSENSVVYAHLPDDMLVQAHGDSLLWDGVSDKATTHNTVMPHLPVVAQERIGVQQRTRT